MEWTGRAPGSKWLRECLGGLSGEGALRAVATIGIDMGKNTLHTHIDAYELAVQ
jgi:hypothetical protein